MGAIEAGGWVLPRAELARAWPALGRAGTVGVAPARPLPCGGPGDARYDSRQWLIGSIRPQAARAQEETRPPYDAPAVALVCRQADGPPPQDAQGWQGWLLRHAPRWPLWTAMSQPGLLMLTLADDGTLGLAARFGPRWCQPASLHLPGTGMWRMPACDRPPEHDGRYGRQAGALGPLALAALQNATIAVVGVGRTGSALAHTLTRAGASVLVMDPDLHLAAHNLDGDVHPLHEGRPKAEAVARWLRPLARPGAVVDARLLDVASPVAGMLLARAEAIVSCVDDDRARFWCAAWAAALHRPHLDVGVSAGPGAMGADIRLTVPADGCLACIGGFADPARLPVHADLDRRDEPQDFRQRRRGSSRSWGMAAAHLGLRLLEGLYAGTVAGSRFRRIEEDGRGQLRATDQTAGRAARCPLCGTLCGAGIEGMRPHAVRAVAAACRAAAERGEPALRRAPGG